MMNWHWRAERMKKRVGKTKSQLEKQIYSENEEDSNKKEAIKISNDKILQHSSNLE